jgi:hypothetical protein
MADHYYFSLLLRTIYVQMFRPKRRGAYAAPRMVGLLTKQHLVGDVSDRSNTASSCPSVLDTDPIQLIINHPAVPISRHASRGVRLAVSAVRKYQPAAQQNRSLF